MPVPSQIEIEEFIREHGHSRLGCSGGCNRDDFDGVKELPNDWEDIGEVRSLKDALSTYETEKE